MIAEIDAIRRALEDISFRNGVAAFFEHEADLARKRCVDALQSDPPNTMRAHEHASRAKAYDEAMGRLKAFIAEGIRQV